MSPDRVALYLQDAHSLQEGILWNIFSLCFSSALTLKSRYFFLIKPGEFHDGFDFNLGFTLGQAGKYREFDAFIIGDGEERTPELVLVWSELTAAGVDRLGLRAGLLEPSRCGHRVGERRATGRRRGELLGHPAQRHVRHGGHQRRVPPPPRSTLRIRASMRGRASLHVGLRDQPRGIPARGLTAAPHPRHDTRRNPN